MAVVTERAPRAWHRCRLRWSVSITLPSCEASLCNLNATVSKLSNFGVKRASSRRLNAYSSIVSKHADELQSYVMRRSSSVGTISRKAKAS